MSDDRFSWGVFINWLLDNIAFRGTGMVRSNLPKIESTDGHEPTTESLREEARQADAMVRKHTKMPKLPASKITASKLDKEFWESQE